MLNCVRARAHQRLHLISVNFDALSEATGGTSLPICDLFGRSRHITASLVSSGANLGLVVYESTDLAEFVLHQDRRLLVGARSIDDWC